MYIGCIAYYIFIFHRKFFFPKFYYLVNKYINFM